MAAIKYARGTKLMLKFGDGAEPEVFAHMCSFILSKSITFTANENTSTIPDCDDPEAIAWEVSEITSKRITLQGSGTLNTPDFDALFEWWDAGASRNMKIVLDVTAADGGAILTGAWKITGMEMSGEEGEKVQISAPFGSDGPVVKTANT